MTITWRLPAPVDLLDRVPHVERGEELALLEVHDPARARRGDDQIRLPDEERRDLEDVGDLGGARRLPRFVDVGQDRHARRLADAREDAQPFVDARAAERPAPTCGWPCRTTP